MYTIAVSNMLEELVKLFKTIGLASNLYQGQLSSRVSERLIFSDLPLSHSHRLLDRHQHSHRLPSHQRLHPPSHRGRRVQRRCYGEVPTPQLPDALGRRASYLDQAHHHLRRLEDHRNHAGHRLSNAARIAGLLHSPRK